MDGIAGLAGLPGPPGLSGTPGIPGPSGEKGNSMFVPANQLKGKCFSILRSIPRSLL